MYGATGLLRSFCVSHALETERTRGGLWLRRGRFGIMWVRRLISIVVPACGNTSGVGSTISDILGRACGGVRMVIISSGNRGRPRRLLATRGVGGCRAFRGMGCLMRGGGVGNSTTEGAKVETSGKFCLNFLSSSSMFLPSGARGRISYFRGLPSSCTVVCNSFLRRVARGASHVMGTSGTSGFLCHFLYGRVVTYSDAVVVGEDILSCMGR